MTCSSCGGKTSACGKFWRCSQTGSSATEPCKVAHYRQKKAPGYRGSFGGTFLTNAMPRLCRSALAPVPPVGTQTQQTESHQGQGRTDRDRVTGIGINLLQGADREVIKREYITFTRTGQKGDGRTVPTDSAQ